MIDVQKIINDTINIFQTDELYKKIDDFVSESDYKEIHKSFLTKTNIKIDVDNFVSEIQKYQKDFVQWGKHHSQLPRYGVALVNKTGKIENNDPINGSLYEWNSLNPHDRIIESDCTTPTKILDLESLNPLRIFDNHWCRSNILYWNKNAEFFPHIDNIVPSPWLRLWGTTDPKGLQFRYYDDKKNDMVTCKNIEAGRIYIIDTSLVHDVKLSVDNNYQFFLSVLPSAKNILKEIQYG